MLIVTPAALDALKPYVEGPDAKATAIRIVFQGYG